jgi:hypothetical protein
VSDAQRTIEELLPMAKIEETNGRNVCYTVARTRVDVDANADAATVTTAAAAAAAAAVDVSLSQVFASVLAAAEASDSEEFGVSQDSLEQIFLLFAKLASEESTMTVAGSILVFRPGKYYINYLINFLWCIATIWSMALVLYWVVFICPMLWAASWVMQILIGTPWRLISPETAANAPTTVPFVGAMCQLFVIFASPFGRELKGVYPTYEIPCHKFWNAVWLVCVGLPLAAIHLSWGVLLCITFVFIPFASMEFSVASALLRVPFTAVIAAELAEGDGVGAKSADQEHDMELG